MADPTITDETLATGVKWVIGAVGTLITVIGGILGVNKLAEMRQKRKYDLKDKHDSMADANQGKQIDADAAAFVIVSDRLKLVESRLDTLQDDLRKQMETNATLAAENKHLQKENDELKLEVKKLRDHRRESDKTIAALRSELDILKLRVDGNGPPLAVKLVDGDERDA